MNYKKYFSATKTRIFPERRFRVDSATGGDWASNGYIAVRRDAFNGHKLFGYWLAGIEDQGDNAPSIESVLPVSLEDYEKLIPTHKVDVSESVPTTYLESENVRARVNVYFMAFFEDLKAQNLSFWGSAGNKPVIVKSDSEVIGLIMPMVQQED